MKNRQDLPCSLLLFSCFLSWYQFGFTIQNRWPGVISDLNSHRFGVWSCLCKEKKVRHHVQTYIQFRPKIILYTITDLVELWTLSPHTVMETHQCCFVSQNLKEGKPQEHSKSDKNYLNLLPLGFWEVATVQCFLSVGNVWCGDQSQ